MWKRDKHGVNCSPNDKNDYFIYRTGDVIKAVHQDWKCEYYLLANSADVAECLDACNQDMLFSRLIVPPTNFYEVWDEGSIN